MKIRSLCIALLSFLTVFAASAAETGNASWYGGKFHGRRTSNGEIYDMEGVTAAHKTLPFGTIVRVTNLENGKQVVVRINDRGPFVKGRIIDLSKGAAKEIDLVKMGVAKVTVEIVDKKAVPQGPVAYVIQVGSFREEGNARRNQEKLIANGVKADCEKTETGYLRLFVRDIDAGELGRVLSLLKTLGFKDPLVRTIKKG